MQGLAEKDLAVPLWPWTQREGLEVSAKPKGRGWAWGEEPELTESL